LAYSLSTIIDIMYMTIGRSGQGAHVGEVDPSERVRVPLPISALLLFRDMILGERPAYTQRSTGALRCGAVRCGAGFAARGSK